VWLISLIPSHPKTVVILGVKSPSTFKVGESWNVFSINTRGSLLFLAEGSVGGGWIGLEAERGRDCGFVGGVCKGREVVEWEEGGTGGSGLSAF